ncbi:hypothetical protein ACFLTJ_02745 [Chloroflexota bacterium]
MHRGTILYLCKVLPSTLWRGRGATPGTTKSKTGQPFCTGVVQPFEKHNRVLPWLPGAAATVAAQSRGGWV